MYILDLQHLLENTFDRKRISTNPNPNPDSKPNSNSTPKAQLCFRTAKWRHFWASVQIPYWYILHRHERDKENSHYNAFSINLIKIITV